MTGMLLSSKLFSPLARACALALFAMASSLPTGAARAQSIVLTVNSDPITTVDIAEREKVLRAIGLPASPAAAQESMIISRLQAGEINKYGIKITTAELAPAVQYYAEKAHVTAEVLSARLSNAHIDKKHLENFLSIHQAFNIYARARNRAVEVSEAETQAEIARDKKLANQTSYTIRQVMITVPPETGMPGLQQAAKQMEALRARFTDCENGPKLVSEYPTLVVREPIIRPSSQLGEQLSALLDKTAVGHLTPASRDSTGLTSLALCARAAAKEDVAKEAAQNRVLQRIVQRDADKYLEELRAHAVIVKSGQ
jgi:peptidyl-prolyl cis-trans isomerase SurA